MHLLFYKIHTRVFSMQGVWHFPNMLTTIIKSGFLYYNLTTLHQEGSPYPPSGNTHSIFITWKNWKQIIWSYKMFQILLLRESIANLILSLIEENGPGATEVAVVSNYYWQLLLYCVLMNMSVNITIQCIRH
jgi:hypothetical protein